MIKPETENSLRTTEATKPEYKYRTRYKDILKNITDSKPNPNSAPKQLSPTRSSKIDRI